MRDEKRRIAVALARLIALACVVMPLRSIADDAADVALREKLEMKVDLALDNATLDQAVNQLQDKTKANIAVDWRTMAAAGIGREKKISLHLKDMELRKALDIIVIAYGDPLVRTAYTARNGIIHLSTRDRTDRETSTFVYDIHDFTDRFILPNVLREEQRYNGLFGALGGGTPPSTVAAPIAARVKGMAVQGRGAPSHYTRQECIDCLVRVIQEEIDPNTWRDNGGMFGAIRELDGLLIVTQLPENQRPVQLILKNLRKLRAAIDRGDTPEDKGIDLLKE